jgi:hypothetical protein
MSVPLIEEKAFSQTHAYVHVLAQSSRTNKKLACVDASERSGVIKWAIVSRLDG